MEVLVPREGKVKVNGHYPNTSAESSDGRNGEHHRVLEWVGLKMTLRII